MKGAIVKTPDLKPFFFPGGPMGCLLVHGFSGSPLSPPTCTQVKAGTKSHPYTIDEITTKPKEHRWPR